MHKPDSNSINLKKSIDKLFEDLSNVSPDSDEFALMVKQMDVLYKLKEADAKAKAHRLVSADVVLTVSANLLGIVLIVGHERAAVVTSKAMAFVSKLR